MLTALLLPPLLLVLLALAGGVLAWAGRRWAGALAALSAAGLLLLATPMAEGWLIWSLEREARTRPMPGAAPPGAIVILGAESARGERGPEVGPMTLERLRAGAALHRRTGLPLLVTGGPLSPGAPPIASLMARSLESDFGVTARWVEPLAPDTRGNAQGSVALLRADGIGSALLVTHAWHMARAREAFDRLGFSVQGEPVRVSPPPTPVASSWVPRPDHLAGSWFALREWLGRLVYAFRDARRERVSESLTAGESVSTNE